MGNCAKDVRLDGAWYTEHSGTKFVTVSKILMEWRELFVHQDNIWQTLAIFGSILMISENVPGLPFYHHGTSGDLSHVASESMKTYMLWMSLICSIIDVASLYSIMDVASLYD